jgi:hypothetical protein
MGTEKHLTLGWLLTVFLEADFKLSRKYLGDLTKSFPRYFCGISVFLGLFYWWKDDKDMFLK